MTNDLPQLAAIATSLLLTYWLHSTVAISLTWLVTRGRESSTLHERLWKFAAIAGVLSAPIQVFMLHRSPDELAAVLVQSSPVEVSVEPPPSGELDSNPGVGANRLAIFAADVTRHEPLPFKSDDAIPVQPLDRKNASEPVAREGEAEDDVAEDFQLAASPTTDTSSPTDSRMANRRGVVSNGSAVPLEGNVYTTWRHVKRFGAALTAGVGFVLGLIPVITISLGGVLMSIRLYALRRRVALAKSVRGAARKQLDQLVDQCDVRRNVRRNVRLLSSDQYAEPVAFGLLQWTIVLPAGIEKRLNADEIRALLAHELGHLVRGDVIWLWIGQLLCLCLPVQPLNFLARRRWQSASEFLCDEWAIGLGVKGLTLARCLTEVAEWNIERSCRVSLAASGDAESTVARVQRLLGESSPADDIWKTRAGRCSLSTGMVVALASIVLLTPIIAIPATAFPAVREVEKEVTASDLLTAIEAAQQATREKSSIDWNAGATKSSSVRLDEFDELEIELQRLNDLLKQTELSPSQLHLARQISRRAALLRELRSSLIP